MTDIIRDQFPQAPGATGTADAAHSWPAVTDAALMRILRFGPDLAQGAMPATLAPMLCAILPDMIEELLEHRRRAAADAARAARLGEIEEAAHAAETIARDCLTETDAIKAAIHALRHDVTELQNAVCELATRPARHDAGTGA